jgi:acyl carrier protein
MGDQGILAMPPEAALRAFERILSATSPQIGVMAVDWSKYCAALPLGCEPRHLAELAKETRSDRAKTPGRPAGEVPFLQRLADAPASKRVPLLIELARAQAVRVLGLDPSRPLDPQRPLHELGLDSLMAVELRNALGAALGRSLPATLLFDYPTLDVLARHLKRLLFPDSLDPSHAEARRTSAVEGLDRLTDEEAELLLLNELRSSKENV